MDRARRLGVTLLLPVVVWLGGQYVRLPGLSRSTLDALAHTASPGVFDATTFSVFVFGVSPILSGFVVVELLAAIVPRWRRRRVGVPSERIPIDLAACALTLLISSIQGWFLARWLAAQPPTVAGSIIEEPGAATAILIPLSVVGATALLLVLAWLASHFGLANGVSTLLASAAVPSVISAARALHAVVDRNDLTSRELFPIGAIAVAIVYGTWWLLGAHRRVEARLEPPAYALRHPTSGFVPVLWAASLLMLPATLAQLWPSRALLRVAGALTPGSTAYALASAVLIAGFTVLLSVAFASPRRTAARVGGTYWTSVGRTAIVLVLIAVVPLVAQRLLHLPFRLLDASTLVLLTAVTVDLAAEWRARAGAPELVAIRHLHQVARVEPVLQALAAASIPAHARAAAHRALLHFFGPYVPITLYVPRDRAADARAIVEQALASA